MNKIVFIPVGLFFDDNSVDYRKILNIKYLAYYSDANFILVDNILFHEKTLALQKAFISMNISSTIISGVQNDGDSLIRNYLLCNPDISRYIILDDGSGSYYSSEIKEHIIRICNNKAKMIDNDDMDNMLNGLNAVRHVR